MCGDVLNNEDRTRGCGCGEGGGRKKKRKRWKFCCCGGRERWRREEQSWAGGVAGEVGVPAVCSSSDSQPLAN